MERFNIYHRQDGRYEGRISKGKGKNGKRCFQYFFGRSREEVLEKMKSALMEEFSGNCGKTVSQIFSEWFQSIQHRVKESTAANYRMKAEKHILPAFSDKKADMLTAFDIYDFIASKQKCGLSNRYISDILVMMKSVFKYASKAYQFFNALDGITLPKQKKPDINLLDEKQQKQLQQYISENPDNSTLGIALSMLTGIRIGELCALRWEDVDLEKRILTVSKTIQRIQTSGGKTKTKVVITEPKSESSKRKIPIPECIVAMLEEIKGKANEYLVSGKETPVEPRTLQYRFVKILKNVKLPSVHFHALRHMFASKCVKLGFDIKSLSEILGHSKVEITLNRYVHSSFEQKKLYMSRITMNF